MRLFMVMTKYGYWESLAAGIIEADNEESALKIAKQWAEKHEKPDYIFRVYEVNMLDFNKPPY